MGLAAETKSRLRFLCGEHLKRFFHEFGSLMSGTLHVEQGVGISLFVEFRPFIDDKSKCS